MVNLISILLKRMFYDISIFLYKNLNNAFRIYMIRKFGGKIGERCQIRCAFLSDETYLIEIGNDVIISSKTNLITHEGGVSIFHYENSNLDLFGTIKIGNNCFIGMNCTILPNTVIGNNCLIGSGSVVRSIIPDNSVVIGNPAKVIMSTNMYKFLVNSNPLLYEYHVLSSKQKKRILLERVAKIKQGYKTE